MDTSLVGKSAETSNGVVERYINLDILGDKVLNGLESLEVVAGLDVFGSRDNHAGHQTTKRGDAVTLTDSEDGSIDVGGTSLTVTLGQQI
jgi:hypothetical protein